MAEAMKLIKDTSSPQGRAFFHAMKLAHQFGESCSIEDALDILKHLREALSALSSFKPHSSAQLLKRLAGKKLMQKR